MEGSNFKLEVEDLGIDTNNIYDNSLVAILADTDSNYINLEPLWEFIMHNEHYTFIIENIKTIIDKKFPKFNNSGTKNDFQYFIEFQDKFVIDNVVEDTLYKFSKQYNLMNIGKYQNDNINLTFEYEDTLLYDLVLAKKKYAKVLYGDDHIKFTGLETKKTNSSKFVRNEVGKFFEDSLVILNKYGTTEKANILINKELKKVKTLFINYAKSDKFYYIGEPVYVNTYNKYIEKQGGILATKKGSPQNVKYLANYQNFITHYKITDLPKAKQGMKIIRFAINKYDNKNKLGFDIISFPIGYEDIYSKYFKLYFDINVKEQWRVKAGGIIERFYKVLNFKETLKTKKHKFKK